MTIYRTEAAKGRVRTPRHVSGLTPLFYIFGAPQALTSDWITLIGNLVEDDLVFLIPLNTHGAIIAGPGGLRFSHGVLDDGAALELQFGVFLEDGSLYTSLGTFTGFEAPFVNRDMLPDSMGAMNRIWPPPNTEVPDRVFLGFKVVTAAAGSPTPGQGVLNVAGSYASGDAAIQDQEIST